jgi:hypothetical protein
MAVTIAATRAGDLLIMDSDVGCGEQREPHRLRLFYEFAIDAVRTSPHPS